MSLQFSCEIVDVYSLLGIISVPTKPPMVFKHEWFIYDTRSHSKPSIFQIIQQDDNTYHLNDKLTIIFRQDKPFIKENMNSKIHQIRPFSNHIDFSPKTHGLDNHYFHFFFAKEHLIKIIYYDLLNNNYEKYFLKKETYSHSGKNITQEINKDEYLKQLLKYKENKYPDLINNQGNIYHVDINDFWTNVDFSLKSIKQATPKLFKWFWAPNHKSIISQSFSQDKATTIEQANQIKQLEDYINSIED